MTPEQFIALYNANDYDAVYRHLKQFPFIRYLPAFYAVPTTLLKNMISFQTKKPYFDPFPRNPIHLFTSHTHLLTDPSFPIYLADAYAGMLWPYFGIKHPLEAFSGYDPIWLLAHDIEIWALVLNVMRILPLEQLIGLPAVTVVDLSVNEFSYIADEMFLYASAIYNFAEIIDFTKQNRAFEDFDHRRSKVKAAFRRKWYHTATKHPMISFENDLICGREKDGTPISSEFEIVSFENESCTKIDTAAFLDKLSEQDRKILLMRLDNIPYEKIAQTLGYKTHSAVIKRIKRIGELYDRLNNQHNNQH